MKLFSWFIPSLMTAMVMMMFGSTSLLAIDGQPKVWSFDGSGIKATNDVAFTSQVFTFISKEVLFDATMAKMSGSGSGLMTGREFGSGASTAFMTPQDGLFFKTDASSSAATSHETMINTGHTSYSSYILKAVTFILMGTIIAFIVTNIGTRKEEAEDIIVGKEDDHHTTNMEHAYSGYSFGSARSMFKSFIVKFSDKEHGAKAYSKHYFGKLMSSIISLFGKTGHTEVTHHSGSPALSSYKA